MTYYFYIMSRWVAKWVAFCLWQGPRFRLKNALDLFYGPYQSRESLELQVEHLSFMTDEKTKSIISSKDDPARLSPAWLTELGCRVIMQRGQFVLRVPLHMSLFRASFFGWEPFLNLKDPAFHAQGDSKFLEVPLPGWGCWRLESDSDRVHFSYLPSTASRMPLSHRLVALLRSALTWRVVASTILHVSLFFALLHVEQVQKTVLSLVPEELLSPEQKEEILPDDAAPEALVAAAEVVEEDHSGLDYQGMSIIAYLNHQLEKQKAEPPKQEQVKSLAQSLKGLSNLFKSPKALNVPSSHPRPTVAGGMAAVGGLSGAFKSLQAGLVTRKGGKGTGIIGTGVGSGKGLQNVSWQSQFLAPAQTGAKGLTDAQQRMISDAFAKHQDRFRACYESSLVLFEELSVAVAFESTFNGDGFFGVPNFKTSGRSTPDSEAELLKCLKSVLTKIKVDPKLSGVKVKNQFVFKS